MKVIFLNDIPSTAKAGDVREVAPGYARNFLLPRRLALPASPQNLTRWQAERTRYERQRQERQQATQVTSERLAQTPCRLQRRAGTQGKLFGAVTAGDLAAALAVQGLSVDKRAFRLPRPLKRVGTYPVEVHLSPTAVVTLQVEIQPLPEASPPPHG